jgi:hypothetical protein
LAKLLPGLAPNNNLMLTSIAVSINETAIVFVAASSDEMIE